MLTHAQTSAQKLLRKLGLSDNLAFLDRAWETELGGLAKRVAIVALDRASLVVEADSSAAVQEISLRRRELVRKINRHFPEPLVQEITVRIAQR
jgi:hypothetical protein